MKTLILSAVSALLFAEVNLCPAAEVPCWESISSPTIARFRALPATLPDGKILITGGQIEGDAGQLATDGCEVFDPATLTFSTTSSMNQSRYLHSVVTLQDGRVLVAGGCPGLSCSMRSSCELFTPATGTWSAAASLPVARDCADMVVLPSGKVLLAGGAVHVCGTIFKTAYLFDPTANGGAGSWTQTGSMGTPRGGVRLTLLNNGKVLACGGRVGFPSTDGTVVSEIYDPPTGTWTNTTGNMTTARGAYFEADMTVIKLPDGRVMVAGGNTAGAGAGTGLNSVELFNPATGTWSLGAPMPEPRELHGTVLLDDGRVLLAGGRNTAVFQGPKNSRIYDPVANTWSAAIPMKVDRELFSISKLPDGSVLAPFGSEFSQFKPNLSAELFTIAQVSEDACPDDPNKTEPGACGCGVADTDADGDETPDCNDACPGDPGKTQAGACGCGVADTDTDSDETPDCNDACPGDSAKTQPGACGCGVADTDADNNGVADCITPCADLSITFNGAWPVCRGNAKKLKCKVEGRTYIANTGAPSGNGAKTTVCFYLSEDAILDSSDIRIDSKVAKIPRDGQRHPVKLNGAVPAGLAAAGKYIIAVVDCGDAIPNECDELNNIAVAGPWAD